MKRLLIAAGMAALLLGAAPAVASPQARDQVTGGYGQGYRDDARVERRDWSRKVVRTQERRRDWDRRRHWNDNRRSCRNERRHHRWVRVCGRR
ncbi:hypothetical protein FPZ24_07060 [Sphingomonas panacisoli]|uniref:Uncharacterized protein n=1 Tax=Sphingomonas panacisoli TaxID=1813879 RepID=A0A5B8LH83_9SPHN|nr:hypothetical protein [Sphingomonas panacisoli]QDZ07266.1 hypothetical protein FPZ24_07060 [Sphingomonas panacisoli]